ncbi:ABC transporter permease [Nocardioides marmoriginsengisoli]|uniref:ABC transporter permease n=1 Tax=Nocardioides marmoriginsengisoli TaxID=661483 RepID=A0A3N0CTK8_9ACTN|nr:ABC transporter permease [Nocardioides marmoriginsengisoli]
MARSTRAELLRLRKWPAVWVTIGSWLAMNAMFAYLFNYLTYSSGESNFSTEGQSRADLLADMLPAALPTSLPQGMPMFGGAIMMVLGAIVAGNGYGWGSWKTVLTQGPSRTSTAIGSLAALGTLVAGVVTATLVTDYAMSLAVALAESGSTALPGLGEMLHSYGIALLVMETWAMAGYLLGTLARGPAVSVGLGLVWGLVIENLLRGVGSSLSWVEAFTHVLPGTVMGSLVGQLVGVDGPDTTPGLLDTVGSGQALWTTIGYLVLLPLIALWLVRRRDVV